MDLLDFIAPIVYILFTFTMFAVTFAVIYFTVKLLRGGFRSLESKMKIKGGVMSFLFRVMFLLFVYQSLFFLFLFFKYKFT
jgi:hypothetical protein